MISCALCKVTQSDFFENVTQIFSTDLSPCLFITWENSASFCFQRDKKSCFEIHSARIIRKKWNSEI